MRSKEPLTSAYTEWVTSRKDWENVFKEVCELSAGWDFILCAITNTADGKEEDLDVWINDAFAKEDSEFATFMSDFAFRHFKAITAHIQKHHNDRSLYRIKEQKVAAQMHIPVNSNIFEIRSDQFKIARILILFQKPGKPSEMELMLRRIQKKVLQKKKTWFF